ncbi:hypothetical protein Tco_1544177, partial [Tanacetum coccineum]
TLKGASNIRIDVDDLRSNTNYAGGYHRYRSDQALNSLCISWKSTLAFAELLVNSLDKVIEDNDGGMTPDKMRSYESSDGHRLMTSR